MPLNTDARGVRAPTPQKMDLGLRAGRGVIQNDPEGRLQHRPLMHAPL